MFQFLLGAVGITLAAALYGGEGIWEVQLVTDLAFLGYVAFLRETKRRRQERDMKVAARVRARVPGRSYFEPPRRREATS